MGGLTSPSTPQSLPYRRALDQGAAHPRQKTPPRTPSWHPSLHFLPPLLVPMEALEKRIGQLLISKKLSKFLVKVLKNLVKVLKILLLSRDCSQEKV